MPDAVAVIFEDTALSYQELDQRADQFAHYLIEQGVQSGDRVALCLERSAELVITLLAILKAGATYVPLDPTYPPERLRFILEDAQVSLLITASLSGVDSAPRVDRLTADSMVGSAHPTREAITNSTLPILDLASEADAIAHHPTTPPPYHPTSPSSLAYLIYTSGSTGTPKGVPIRHQSLTNLLSAMAQAPGMTATDTLLAVTTPAFDIAALELFLPLTVGGILVIANQETVRDPHKLTAQLEQHDVTLMQATPATWRLLLESGWSGKANLKLLCGGEALDVSKSLWNVAQNSGTSTAPPKPPSGPPPSRLRNPCCKTASSPSAHPSPTPSSTSSISSKTLSLSVFPANFTSAASASVRVTGSGRI